MAFVIAVRVKPNGKQAKIDHQPDGSLVVKLRSPPVDGKANQELIQLLAKEYGVKKSQVRVKSGAQSRQKLIEIG